MALALQLYMLVVVLDVLLAWVQPDPRGWPRRPFHWLTEPLQAPLRRLPWRDWDLSPVLVIAALGAVRLWLVRS